MSFQLTLLQRVVLGVAAAGILIAVFLQTSNSYSDFGFWWIVPVALAVGLALLAASPTGQVALGRPVAANATPLWRDQQRQVVVMEDAAKAITAILHRPQMRDLVGDPRTDADSVQLQTIAEEGIKIRAFTYGYILTVILCKQQDRRFFGGPEQSALRQAYANVCAGCWLRVFGGVAREGAESERAVSSLKDTVEKTKELELAIDNRLVAGDKNPLLPLYQYLDGSLVRGPSADQLEARFGPVTKALLVRHSA